MSDAPIGWVNAHTHMYSGLAPFDIPPIEPAPDSFLDILRGRWWRMDRALSASSLRTAARWYIGDALLRGTTGLIDHHESPDCIDGSLDVLADACQELGMPALLCYGASERNGGLEEGRRGLNECRRFLESNERNLVRGFVGLHASFTVSDTLLREAGELAREFKTGVHVHVAEDTCDLDDARQRGYASPLQRMLSLDALPDGSILAHGVHLTEDDIELACDRDLSFVQNPRSNVGNAVGYPRLLGRLPHVALGTDGWPSDRVEETSALVIESAKHDDDPGQVAHREQGGHGLLARAFEGDQPTVVQGLGSLVVDDRIIVDEGSLQTADFESLRRDAERDAQVLWTRMKELA
ncbi:MAG: cytosine/adenosine deaminase-related metal-dependent hydrolase [Planctomycetota bacterium]|jgi:cytosine/adenosine deaminase-related metal-dependent hydrolase